MSYNKEMLYILEDEFNSYSKEMSDLRKEIYNLNLPNQSILKEYEQIKEKMIKNREDLYNFRQYIINEINYNNTKSL